MKYIIPSAITCAGLFAGFYSIILSISGDFSGAALAVGVALLCDVLDGPAARALKATSKFGAELDSLCDAVSFGVAPSVMIYLAALSDFGALGLFVAFLPALGGVLRLARFNAETGGGDKERFKGMPVPAAAMTLAAFIYSIYFSPEYGAFIKDFALFFTAAATSLAMVSNLPYDAFFRPTPKNIRAKPFTFAAYVGAFVAVFVTKGDFLYPAMIAYLILSPLKYFYIEKK